MIDFQHPAANHFLAIRELKIHGNLYRCRMDIVGFVNGIPLLFMEFKRTTVDVQEAYHNNYTDYLDTIPHLFSYNAFLVLSNGMEAKVGTLGSKYEFFNEWKRLSEGDEGSVALETLLCGICKKETFLDLLENFIIYDHSGGRIAKILARNHQYLGVNEANAEQDRASIEKTFMELMELANSMDEEQQRYVREGFSSDEELSMYDLLFTENPSKQDNEAIKKVAVELLAKVKAKIAELDHWTDKQETKATIDNLIRDTLWAGLPECYDDISVSRYRQQIYEYVYTRYKDVA